MGKHADVPSRANVDWEKLLKINEYHILNNENKADITEIKLVKRSNPYKF